MTRDQDLFSKYLCTVRLSTLWSPSSKAISTMAFFPLRLWMMTLRPSAISETTGLPPAGLCIESGNQIKIGSNSTHLAAQSPFIFNHHKNWRIKGLEWHNNLSSDELMYTAPSTVSIDDFLLFLEKVVQ